MEINFFELKYLIVDSFYCDVLKNGYSYEQAAGICYESFYGYISGSSIECIVALCSILRLKLRHGVKLNEHDITDMEKVMSLFETLDVKSSLNEVEYEYLEEDVFFIKEKIKSGVQHPFF